MGHGSALRASLSCRFEDNTLSQSVLADGARGGALVVAGSLTKAVVQVLSVTILARLLLPEDFGVVALVAVFIALGSLLRDFGLPTVALQAPELSHQQASNMFWLNVAFGSATAVGLCLATPLLAAWFNEPLLWVVVPSMASLLLLGGLSAQLHVQLSRNMRYRALVIGEVVSMVAGLGSAVALAAAGASYWALIAQHLVAAVVLLAMRFAATRWKPIRFRRGNGACRALAVGAEYTFVQLLAFLQTSADSLVVGWRFGSTTLGYYNRGLQLLAFSSLLLGPLMQVVVPTLNRARAQGRALGPMLLRIQFVVGLAVIGVLAIAAGTAQSLVPFLLGGGWERTIPIFQALAVGGCFYALSMVNHWGFVVTERSRALLQSDMISKPLVIVCVAIGSAFGVVGIAVGYSIGMALAWPVSTVWLGRATGVPVRRFFANGVLLITAGAAGALTAVFVTALTSVASGGLAIAAGAAACSIMILLPLSLVPDARRNLRGAFKLLKLLGTQRAG